MFSKIISIFNNPLNQEVQEEEEVQEVFPRINSEQDLAEEYKKMISEDISSEDNMDKCFRGIGTLTHSHPNYGTINDQWDFIFAATYDGSEPLVVGMKLSFLAYQATKKEALKIFKILGVAKEEECNEAVFKKTTSGKKYENCIIKWLETHKTIVFGLVSVRDDNMIVVETNISNVFIDLDLLPTKFSPEEGDKLYLNCVLTKVNGVHQIADTIEITPTKEKHIQGKITQLEGDWGAIEEVYYFKTSLLPKGYIPKIEDELIADAIESNQVTFDWRCYNLKPSKPFVEDTKTENQDSEIIEGIDKFKRWADPEWFLVSNGIEITEKIEFKFKNIGETDTKEVFVTNRSGGKVEVVRSLIGGHGNESQLQLIYPKWSDSFSILSSETRSFKIQCNANHFGLSEEVFAIEFADCTIARKVTIEVGTEIEYVELETLESPSHNSLLKIYAYKVWTKKNLKIIPGIKLTEKPRCVTNRILYYAVPEQMLDIVLKEKDGQAVSDKMEFVYPFLLENLNASNYCIRTSLLLHMEEIENFINIRNYDKSATQFVKEGEYLSLEIENLLEKRPSLIVSDTLRASLPNSETNTNCYEGVIHKIKKTKILVKFNAAFHASYNNEYYRVEFIFSRFNFRKQHHAVLKAFERLGAEFLFPSKITLENDVQLNVQLDANQNLILNESKLLEWHNPGLNSVQKVAIMNIMRGEARPMPYVIFGPPGTGKTMTLVELVIQLITNIPSARVIIATPSNSAADLLATRLMESNVLKKGDFIRLVSQNVFERDSLPENLKAHSATIDIRTEGSTTETMVITESGLKLRCTQSELGTHLVTISTCATIGNFLQMGFPDDHFTHVILDEAGQCLETEAMMAICQVKKDSGQVILAGDSLQLGPIVLNKLAAQKGLEISFLERLLSRTPYSKDKTRFSGTGYDQRLLTKLIYNYRSIPSVLATYNSIFYDSELRPMIDAKNSPEATKLKLLENFFAPSKTRPKEHGVFFVGIRGGNKQDSDSPSWYNISEAHSLFMFVLKLYSLSITANDIGIITPYQRQVREIRGYFNQKNVLPPKIGSVEEFQGQERNFILISTVRSNKHVVPVDLRQALGFVQNPKRMNVAISRARSLLVVFGNPHLLCQDVFWGKLVKYCVDADAYQGCDLPMML